MSRSFGEMDIEGMHFLDFACLGPFGDLINETHHECLQRRRVDRRTPQSSRYIPLMAILVVHNPCRDPYTEYILISGALICRPV